MPSIKFGKEQIERSVLAVYPDAKDFAWDNEGSLYFDSMSGKAGVVPMGVDDYKEQIQKLTVSVAYFQGAVEQADRMFASTLKHSWIDEDIDDDDDDEIIPGVS